MKQTADFRARWSCDVRLLESLFGSDRAHVSCKSAGRIPQSQLMSNGLGALSLRLRRAVELMFEAFCIGPWV
jgi:hypothetical protein